MSSIEILLVIVIICLIIIIRRLGKILKGMWNDYVSDGEGRMVNIKGLLLDIHNDIDHIRYNTLGTDYEKILKDILKVLEKDKK